MDHTAGWPVTLAVELSVSKKAEVLVAARAVGELDLAKMTLLSGELIFVRSLGCPPGPWGRLGRCHPYDSFSNKKTKALVPAWLVVPWLRPKSSDYLSSALSSAAPSSSFLAGRSSCCSSVRREKLTQRTFPWECLWRFVWKRPAHQGQFWTGTLQD